MGERGWPAPTTAATKQLYDLMARRTIAGRFVAYGQHASPAVLWLPAAWDTTGDGEAEGEEANGALQVPCWNWHISAWLEARHLVEGKDPPTLRAARHRRPPRKHHTRAGRCRVRHMAAGSCSALSALNVRPQLGSSFD